MKLNTYTLRQTIRKLKQKEFSHSELYKDIHGIIAEKNETLNIYLCLDAEAVKKAERNLDKPLAGVPIAIKDNFLTKDLATTASARLLEGFHAPYESTVTHNLHQSGGVIVGKTNMDAWAHGSSTETSDFGPSKNPRNPSYLPGGSSGGSAAAVAADMCVAAIGSETAGSIRQPSSWCGVVGIKPTYGRVSRYGVVAMGSSLDSPGPIGKTVFDCSLLLNSIAGYDQSDATTSDRPVPDFTHDLDRGVKGMKIGLCYVDHPKLKGTPASEAVEKAAKLLEGFGAEVNRVPIAEEVRPDTILTPDYAVGVYTVIQRSEVSSNLARYDGIRYGHDRSYFSEEAKRRMMLGTFTLSTGHADQYYVRAEKVRSLIIQNFRQLFARYDVLISPTSSGYAQKLGASRDNPMFGEIEDMLMEPSSISGLSGVSVPCFHDPVTNLYLGLNIVADQWQEEKALRAAYTFEQHTDWNLWASKERDNG
ncbi:Asp-tRNA(Asn)/Glu-tRNA(Gln) amidotransferase subunit GatA [Candidatus Gottesmanbacteria bacterium]|nr:Asp-tRNA(Asn)/Glu-tRNA(Gln) amidotransferase subunit GatA [Candidatus Gottesmanbacteria bacterium]